jgi:tetratricopeptide (TPR) repeat protein
MSIPIPLPGAPRMIPFGPDQPCLCGASAVFRQCCGRPGLPLGNQGPLVPDALVAEIRAMPQPGQPEDAIRQCKTLHALAPRHAGALELWAQLARGAAPRAALEPLARLRELEPNNHNREADLAGVYYALHELPAAETHARRALAMNALNPQAHNLLGMVFADIGQPEDAEFHFRQVLQLHEPVAPICVNLANIYRGMGRLDEAEALFRQALFLDPDNIDGLLAWVRMEEARNDLARAWELLERVPAKFATYSGVHLARSALYRRGKQPEKALAELDVLRERNPEVAQLPAFCYERGEVLDALGRYDDAFGSFHRANERVRAQGPARAYQEAYFADLAVRLKQAFTRDRLAQIEAAARRTPLAPGMPAPIFIVGFPRSGTTLVEQMLSAHSGISAGDELQHVWRLTQLAAHMCGSAAPYPECLANLALAEHAKSIDKFRSFYISNVELRRIVEKGKRRFTDKMPLNETHLGLIHLVFPEMPIVHLVRHPLDVVLSAYFNDLTHGGNCAYGLDTAARHYALIFELIRHYRAELDLNYHAVRYEDLVEEPEPNLRALLEFLGEPWEVRCLEFHENVRYARTASYAQVKEPLYRRSRFRYRNYRREIGPILPILAPAIEALGYGIES